jgi:ubiquinone/menaquinone biosynthesis C-methylase UbiE
MMDSKEIVRRGYDRFSLNYRDDQGGSPHATDQAAWLGELTPLLPAGANVLEMGCGSGLPVAKTLSESFNYTGIDISPVQVERARRLVPKARFMCADMTAVNFPLRSFDAVLSLFSIIHVPVLEQPRLFANVYDWLRPMGYFLVSVGSREWTGVEEDWLGVRGATMYWSHAEPETYHYWLTRLGFDLLWSRFVREGDGGHQLILAQKPKLMFMTATAR